jgi:hypothetical protein
MWDAFDGALRCSYRGYNAVDEVEPAISVCFSNDGSQIHAGYKKSIKTFYTDRFVKLENNFDFVFNHFFIVSGLEEIV